MAIMHRKYSFLCHARLLRYNYTQKKQTFSSSGQKPVTVECAILFSQSLKVAFHGKTQKE